MFSRSQREGILGFWRFLNSGNVPYRVISGGETLVVFGVFPPPLPFFDFDLLESRVIGVLFGWDTVRVPRGIGEDKEPPPLIFIFL